MIHGAQGFNAYGLAAQQEEPASGGGPESRAQRRPPPPPPGYASPNELPFNRPDHNGRYLEAPGAPSSPLRGAEAPNVMAANGHPTLARAPGHARLEQLRNEAPRHQAQAQAPGQARPALQRQNAMPLGDVGNLPARAALIADFNSARPVE